MSELLTDDDPEIILMRWLIDLQFPNNDIKITPSSLYDIGHITLVKTACDNINNLPITDVEKIYFAHKYPLIHEYLLTSIK
jgi:hypothetical protein